MDDEGNWCMKFYVYDQDRTKGSVRLRLTDDYSQLYVDFKNIAWVYNIE